MSLTLLFKVGSGGTGPYVSLEDKIGATFPHAVQSIVDGISPHVEREVPEFVRSDHPIFVNFLEAYYEWLEQKINVFGRTVLLQDISDIDRTLDEYVGHFKKQFLLNFPEKLATDQDGNSVDEKTLLKNIKDFYQTKGSEKSYQLLFRLLYDSACDFYYPKEDILRASDGRWIEEQAIKITSANGVENFKMSGNKIEQINRNNSEVTASARVYRVSQYNIGPHEVTELFINSIVGEFKSGEDVFVTIDDGTVLSEVVYGLFSDIVILEEGEGYKTGDRCRIDDGLDSAVQNMGEGGKGKVNEVSLKGSIKTAIVDNGGVNYTEPLPLVFDGGNGRARATMNPKALISYPGYFKSNNGKLSSNKRIQDGHYYQDYSYVLKAEISLDTYKEVLKKLIHPAGMRMFGSISIMKSLQSDQPFHSEHQSYEIPVIGHYTPYKVSTTYNLRDNGLTVGWSGPTGEGKSGDLYALGYNPGTTTNNHCYGDTGGKLIVRGGSLTAGSFPAGLAVSGDTSGASGEVMIWDTYQGTGGTTIGVMYLQSVTGMIPDGFVVGELIGTTSGDTAGGGFTAEILNVLSGNGTVVEGFTIGHDPRNLPLGTAGADGYTAAQEYFDLTGLTAYNYWQIYTHPNTRGLSGEKIAGGWTHGIPSGMSFDQITLRTFFKMGMGKHYHSNPSVGSLYYDGISGDSSVEYSIPYGSTSESPNI